ncbi:isoleucine--tRNA ligase [Cytobacillus horneckiae]|uniref:Isoleucine--tRNA ligase n=1 Tax=Cytobacillus horneckiae TaxID=549687 RepID=A0A2N0ZLP6_9BACI|nr:isoleucine--tRNA ligase [Cytobacillus horneckiae]MEC1156025.1 isoleucine--tRNA ligase [Cytobacillus horneckiae]MED2937385.1 isoleucine--tRNA ligase [Cytobacillus horneckiae]PKG30430.1 isoleucine--tRNA ligase [Cytobacillus horneckiae]
MKETAAERELRVRKLWEEENVFEQSIVNREGRESYVFYEGPPTANGLPHAGHALGRTIKDFVARYKTMSGFKVLRKAGWDTHGLPVELEVEKMLNIRGKDEIEAYGVESFIEKCKESVFTYEKEWRQFTNALGYWVDMDDPYITLQNSYIESVWYILSEIHKKDLLYKGHRVVPYCPHCETSLSSHEVAQGYKDVTDLSATAKFRLKENEFLLGWTTTPWTLPSNVAIAVNPEMTYIRAKQGNEVYIVAETLAEKVLKSDYTILDSFKGEKLVGLTYEAPFNYLSLNNSHKVLPAQFVTETSGTGLVHIAPAHGEDDYKLIAEHGLDFINAVDRKGCYKDDITPLAGRFVKDCDVDIIKMLAAKGLLFDKQKYEHSYPHCWRCDSPLLYYAMEGWFIKTTAVKEKMQSNNQQVEWHPLHMRDGRFGNFLENMVDWNIGRNRYWGTPLNVWVCQACRAEKSPSSIKQLQEMAIEKVADNIELHKPYVDEIHLKCDCSGVMKRTNEVIDVWFDSGSMPFAQYHYPFENQAAYHNQYPADVVIEGVDQTRGWFYSLLAVSTLFTGKAPYKRVLSLGHILDENGQKMSKSKGNALNPVELINEFGADALRWALLADSAPWNNKRFSNKTVAHAKSKVIDTLQNVFAFYQMYAEIDDFNPKNDQGGEKTTLDKWMISRLHTVINEVRESLDQYDMTKGARSIAGLLDEVSNWYVRRSRQRFWKSGMDGDKQAAFTTLYEVLTKLTQLMAPYTPFITDDIYTKLNGDSVHLSDFPKSVPAVIDEQLEKDMDAVLQIVELTRSIRTNTGLKTKQPLATVAVIPANHVNPTRLQAYASIVEEETNVKEVVVANPTDSYLQVELKLNFAVAGRKFGKLVNVVKQQIEALSYEEKQILLKEQEISLKAGSEIVHLTIEDVLLEKRGKEGFEIAEGKDYTVALDTRITPALKEEGLVREVIRAVQNYRKELNLPVELRVDLFIKTKGSLQSTLIKFEDLLHNNLLVNKIHYSDINEMRSVQIEEEELQIAIQTNA